MASLKASGSLRARACALLLTACAGSLAAAMLAYPGGTWTEPKRPGYSFLENYWCDLLRRPAHSGLPNELGASLGGLGFVLLAVALGLFFSEIAGLLPSRSGSALRFGGAATALLTAAVALVPSDAFPVLHAPVVLGASLLGFSSGATCALWALAEARRRPAFAAASALLLVTVAGCVGLYMGVAYVPGYRAPALPALQKLATFTLFGWILLGLREAATASHPRP